MRVKGGTVRAKKRKRLLKHAKGFMWRRKNVYRLAKEAIHKAWADMYVGRKQKKRNFRRLWNVQINAACRMNGITYSKFIHGLKQNNVDLNRKTLSELANTNPEAFKQIVQQVSPEQSQKVQK